MSKKVLVLRSPRLFKTVTKISELIKELDPDLEISISYYPDYVFRFVDGEIKISDNKNSTSLDEYDFLHFFGGKSFDAFEPIEVYSLLNKLNNSSSGNPFKNFVNKITQSLLLSYFDKPIPNTLFTTNSNKYPNLIDQDPNFNYPLILKDIHGTMGNDNYLIRNRKELEELCNYNYHHKAYIIQEFIPNEFDYRIITLNYKVTSIAERRRPINAKSHLNNVAKGSTKSYIDIHDVNEDIINDCVDFAINIQRTCCAFDVIVNSQTKEHYFIEFSSKFGIRVDETSREIPALINYYNANIKSDSK